MTSAAGKDPVPKKPLASPTARRSAAALAAPIRPGGNGFLSG
jgi:hypothetical protein